VAVRGLLQVRRIFGGTDDLAELSLTRKRRVQSRTRTTMPPLDPFTRMRFERGAQHLHRLGPRAVSEFVLEVADQIGGLPCIVDQLGQYERRLTPAMVRMTGGDRSPPRLPRAVP
jgi:hypothetical protein